MGGVEVQEWKHQMIGSFYLNKEIKILIMKKIKNNSKIEKIH